MKQGVYKIINQKNNKCYIGSSANIEIRWEHHKLRLRSGDHHNKHLQSAWNKYGENNFLFVVIEYTNNLIEREQFWIDKWQVCDKNKGYGRKYDEVRCKAMSEGKMKKKWLVVMAM